MNWIPNIFRRRKLYHDLSEEMRLHIEERADQLMGEGMSPAEAQRQARVAFGNTTVLEERSREVWQWPTLESIWGDVQFALRQLRRSPGFAFAAITTLALAISANTVVFAVMNALVLRPLHVPSSENLYVVGHAHSIWGYESYLDYRDLRDRNRSFDGLAADDITQGSKRLKELGIRVALGAQRKELLQAALGRAFKLLAIGSTAGLGLGILATRVLSFIVYQATPRDPLVLAGVVLAMAVLGLVATWIPAQRALSVDPLVLLREE